MWKHNHSRYCFPSVLLADAIDDAMHWQLKHHRTGCKATHSKCQGLLLHFLRLSTWELKNLGWRGPPCHHHHWSFITKIHDLAMCTRQKWTKPNQPSIQSRYSCMLRISVLQEGGQLLMQYTQYVSVCQSGVELIKKGYNQVTTACRYKSLSATRFLYICPGLYWFACHRVKSHMFLQPIPSNNKKMLTHLSAKMICSWNWPVLPAPRVNGKSTEAQ